MLAWTRGRFAEAESYCEQALAIYRELNDAHGICREILSRGILACERGELALGQHAFEEVIALARQQDVSDHVPIALISLGEIAIAEGRLDDARALSEEGLALLSDKTPTGETEVAGLLNLAHVANLETRHNDAAALARQAVEGALDRIDRIAAAEAAIELAWPLAEQGQTARSARILGAALEVLDRAGVSRQQTALMCEQAVRNALSFQLDDDSLRTVLDEARTDSFERVIADELHHIGRSGTSPTERALRE
jgi:tetratricopeptide (TPR) repeat protein